MNEYTKRFNELVDDVCRVIPDVTENTRRRVFEAMRANIEIAQVSITLDKRMIEDSFIDHVAEADYSARDRITKLVGKELHVEISPAFDMPGENRTYVLLLVKRVK